MKILALIGLLPLFLGTIGNAQSLQSYCYTNPRDFKVVEGLNIDKKFPIASVSKLVTSFWALSTKGPDFTYLSIIHVNAVSNGEFDLHIQGSRDPYFGQEKLHYIISKLNEKGITKIRNLSFDENFLYLKDLDIERDPLKEKYSFPWKNYYVSPVTQSRTLSELRKGFIDNYANSVKRMASAKIKLLPKVNFTVKHIGFNSSKKFVVNRTTRSFALRSAPLYKLIKEMHRNSNNFAAVEIFKMLGGREKFAPFIKKTLGMGPETIDFYEGSGNRAATAPIYNQATCRSLLVIMKSLSELMQKYSMDIDDIVSVMGEDGLVNEGYPYINDINSKSGVAKTGSSGAAMTLGGMLNTKPQRMYFMYNVNPVQYTSARKRVSRNILGSKIRNLSKKFANSMSELDYKKSKFISFDSQSFDEISRPDIKP
jgi:serine-type D-Ala-D-Ala carboxypeptidase/endopeptidase (penicillin-binding protein 4)